jgi:hypothetical protein
MSTPLDVSGRLVGEGPFPCSAADCPPRCRKRVPVGTSLRTPCSGFSAARVTRCYDASRSVVDTCDLAMGQVRQVIARGRAATEPRTRQDAAQAAPLPSGLVSKPGMSVGAMAPARLPSSGYGRTGWSPKTYPTGHRPPTGARPGPWRAIKQTRIEVVDKTT